MSDMVPVIGVAIVLIGAVIGLLRLYVIPNGRRMGRNIVILSLLGTVMLSSLTVVNSQSAQQPSGDETVTPVEVLTVQRGDLDVTLSATGTLAATNQAELVFGVSAPVIEVLVEVGDLVQAGDILARVDATDAQSSLRNAEIALAEAQASLDALVAPPSDIDIRLAEASVTAAQASLYAAAQGPSEIDIQLADLDRELANNQLWQTQLNRDSQLSLNPEFRGDNAYAEETVLQAQVEQTSIEAQIARTEYEEILNTGPDIASVGSANADLEAAQSDLDVLMSGASELEKRQLEIDLETARLDVELAQKDLDETVITAPFSGVVAAENLTLGALPPSDSAMTLIDTSRFTIDVSISETDINLLQVGQRVSLNVQALDDVDLTGVITHLDIAPTASGQLVTYNAEVVVDPNDAWLRVGMSATALIVLDEISNVIKVPNRFIQTDPITRQTSVTVQSSAGIYESVPVTLGVRSNSESEITNGLSEGQTIVILPSEDEADGGFGFPGFPGGGAPGGGFPGGAPPGGGGGFGG